MPVFEKFKALKAVSIVYKDFKTQFPNCTKTPNLNLLNAEYIPFSFWQQRLHPPSCDPNAGR